MNNLLKSLFFSSLMISISQNAFAMTFSGDIDGGYRSFAINSTDQNISLNAQLSNLKLPRNEQKYRVDLLSYFENTPKKEFYLDVPTFLYRFNNGEATATTIGRFHPLEELDKNYNSNYLDSIGVHWALNEQNPFNIKNVGWIGVGQKFKISKKWKAIFSFSPVFIPNMSPTVYYSNSKLPSSQSLFARTPPTKVKINESTYLPLMISLDNVDLKKILLQNQVFIGINYENNNQFSLSLFAYSAPTPTPSASTKEKLIIKDQNVRILVDVNPIFERENNIGFNLNKKSISFQGLYKIETSKLTLSSSYQIFKKLKIGGLHTFSLSNSKQTITGLIDPIRDQLLTWLDFESNLYNNFKFNSLLIKNFNQENNGMSLQLGVDYIVSSSTNLYFQAQIYTGNDNSYYGAWRHLDFISTGVRATW